MRLKHAKIILQEERYVKALRVVAEAEAKEAEAIEDLGVSEEELESADDEQVEDRDIENTDETIDASDEVEQESK